VIGFFFIVEVPDTCDESGMSVFLSPLDSFPLRFEGTEDAVGVIFSDVIFDRGSLRAPLRPSLYVHIGHLLFPLPVEDRKLQRNAVSLARVHAPGKRRVEG
jgi:hypothetical protein